MPSPPQKDVDVVIGIVFREGRMLVCQRRSDNPALPGIWEFPGGKQEPGESLECCLHRELEEELAIRVRPLGQLPVVEHTYANIRVRLHPFLCVHLDGEPLPIACQQFHWAAERDLCRYEFPAANAQIIQQISQWIEANDADPATASFLSLKPGVACSG
jgi:A/G-specific adenine glycosylase